MKKLRRIIAVITAAFLTLSVGCGNGNSVAYVYDKNVKVSKIGSIQVAKNDFASLEWDEKQNVILINCNEKTFSTTPYDYYKGAEGSSRTSVVCTATVMLNYISQPGNAIKTLYSQDVLKRGAYSAEKIKNGIKVTYYFHSIEAVIPVSYVLEEGYLKISVNTAEIKEGEQKLYQIAVAPYLTSVKNNSQGGYLFIPSGCGALINTDSQKSGVREYSENMYGGDLAVNTFTLDTNTAGLKLPVFGSKNGDTAVFGIIESGAESSMLNAIAGDDTLGYSAVYPVFPLRGSNQVQVNLIYDGAKQNTAYYADDITEREISIRYYFLTDDDADYNGMAKIYRNYLQENGCLTEKVENKTLYLSIVGGMLTDRLFAGVPYRKLTAATTLEQAENIITQTSETTGEVPVVQLKGYGTTGLDVGKTASGKTVSNAFGGIKAYKSLAEKYENVFVDFDLVNYNKGTSLAAKTANNETVYGYDYDVITGSIIENRKVYKLLSRKNLIKIADSLKKSLDKNSFNGVSLSSLGTANYSDYSDETYALCKNIENDVKNIISKFNVPVMTENSNAYAASVSEHIIDVPVSSSKYISFDYEIPFYQMVFRGYVSMAVKSDFNIYDILNAAESGIGLSFTVADHFDDVFVGLPYAKMISSGIYGDVKDNICEYYNLVSDCVKKVGNSEILSHSIIANGVTETVFENGVTVYVNKTDRDYQNENLFISANNFLVE